MTHLPGASTPPAAEAAPLPQTSGAAVASLIVAILGWLCLPIVGGFASLILGVVALSQIGRSHGRLKGRGMAIVAIIMSIVSTLVYIAMTIIVFYVMCWAHMDGPGAGELTESVSAARQLAAGTLNYAAVHNGQLPPRDGWDRTLLDAGLISRDCLRDPSMPPGSRRFAMNAALEGLTLRNLPSDTVLFFECEAGSPPSGGKELLPRRPHHARKFVVAFVDGHAEAVPPERMNSLRWTPPENLLPAEAPDRDSDAPGRDKDL